jgi:hypothetical protein
MLNTILLIPPPPLTLVVFEDSMAGLLSIEKAVDVPSPTTASLLYISIAVLKRDYKYFHALKFLQFAKAPVIPFKRGTVAIHSDTESATTKPAPMIDFHMQAFSTSGLYETAWMTDGEISARRGVSGSVIYLKTTKDVTNIPHDGLRTEVYVAVGRSQTRPSSGQTEHLCLQRVSTSVTVAKGTIRDFLQSNYRIGYPQHLVIGSHGLGDRLSPSDYWDDPEAITVWELSKDVLVLPSGGGPMRLLSITFDSCLMGTLETGAALQGNTSHVLAPEGYMWEADRQVEKQISSSHTMGLLGGMVSVCTTEPLSVFGAIVDNYVSNTLWGDLAIFITASCVKLLAHFNSKKSPVIVHNGITDRPTATGKAVPSPTIDEATHKAIRRLMGSKRDRDTDTPTITTTTAVTAGDPSPSTADTKPVVKATSTPGIPPIDVDAGITWLYDIDTLLFHYCTPPTAYTKWCRAAWALYREAIQHHLGPTGEEAKKYYSTPLRGASVVIY